MKKLLSLILIVTMLIPMSASLSALQASAVTAQGTHGLYLNCSASVTGYKSDGFMIDFFTDTTDAPATYWSLANWSMYTPPSMSKYGYYNLGDAGSYLGVQTGYSMTDRSEIMSFWARPYTDKAGNERFLYAEAMIGDASYYHHEGDGSGCRAYYPWESNKWYTQLLYCWDDEETGMTFVGSWMYDYSADKWNLLIYYNTKLIGSYINTDVNQFLENFSVAYNNRYRSWRFRNVYFLPHGRTSWVSQPKVSMNTDYNAAAVGVTEMGISADRTYVWGTVDGRNGQNVPDESYTSTSKSFTLNQPSSPTLGTPEIGSFDISDPTAVRWEMAEHSTPQLAYELDVTDVAGRTLLKLSGTRPEAAELSLPELGTQAYKCTLTVRDVFGKTAAATAQTEAYTELLGYERPEETNCDDANGDGDLSIADVSAVLDALSGSAAIDADLDGDGVSEISDVAMLLDLLAGRQVTRYSKGLEYTPVNGGEALQVSDVGTCADTDIVIPPSYGGLPVVSVGDYAFTAAKEIRTVTLPDTVTAIGDYAFAACEGLEGVVLPASLETLGRSVFSGDAALTGVRIPSSLEEIGRDDFANCASLEEISGLSGVTRVNEGAFSGCEALSDILYEGTEFWRIRVLSDNDPFFGANSSFSRAQSAKNGLVQEDGGVRLYTDGVMTTGYATINGYTLYFYPSTGLNALGTVNIGGVNRSFAPFRYDDLLLGCLEGSEPDKESEPQEWLKWLVNFDAASDDPAYKRLSTGTPVANKRRAECSDPSAWETVSGSYVYKYKIDLTDGNFAEGLGSDDYDYFWELWYREAGTENDYRRVSISPLKAETADGSVTYYFDTLSAGMTDLSTDEGEARRYEFILIGFKEGTTSNDILFWNRDFVSYTDSSEAFANDAVFAGFVDIGDPYYNEEGYIKAASASKDKMYDWGAANDPNNVRDGNPDTVCGAGYAAGMSVRLNFKRPEYINEIYLCCKDEGTTPNADGSHGTYDVYAVYAEKETLIRENVPAYTGTDGGSTVTLDAPVAAEGIVVKITSWQGSAWACVADLLVKATGETPEKPHCDENGWILNMTADRSGFGDFGDVNKPENVLDGKQSTVCGSGYNASVDQYVSVYFPYTESIDRIFIQCKDEGTTPNADGSHGTYRVVTLDENGNETVVASSVPAVTGSAGGYTLDLQAPVTAKGVRVYITSWQGSAWACVADILVKIAGVEPPEQDRYDENGRILNMTATSSGFAGFGDVNAPSNVLDDDQDTVCGAGFTNGTQNVTVTFPNTERIKEIFIRCKDEGTTTNADGTRGTYRIVAVRNGAETLLSQSVPAVTGTDGGYTLTLDSPVTADAVHVYITSWQGNCWACVADIAVTADV